MLTLAAETNAWQPLVEIVILLVAALVLGTVAEWFKQNAIVGYLVAGTLVGPHVFGLVKSSSDTELVAEIGVALLLFTIGLEFSFAQLRAMGRKALLLGVFQVTVTTAVTSLIAMGLGMAGKTAFAVGIMVAMSSTACVLRLMRERAELDTAHGRNALGVLLVQDVAVIPALVLISALGYGGGPWVAAGKVGLALLAGVAMLGVFYLLSTHVVPRALHLKHWTRNRELPILLAIVMALGATVFAHSVGLSPAMGAFLAGLLLGGSPFAVQIRSDITALRTVLVTFFFASIGMLGNPTWALEHIGLVLAVVVAIVTIKAGIILIIMRVLRQPWGIAVASGLVLSQVGEFSFVIAQIASGANLVDEELFRLIVSATIITLFITPYLIRIAPHAARAMESFRRKGGVAVPDSTSADAHHPAGVIIIGFGPAGQRVAESLLADHKEALMVIDANPHNVKMAQSYGLSIQVGDATQREVIEHAGIEHAVAVVITVPDALASRQIIHLCRQLNANATLLARARYHVFRWELQFAGAQIVVDEEDHVGMSLAQEVRGILGDAQ